MSEFVPNSLFEETSVIFRKFSSDVEEKVKEYLPLTVPKILTIINYCKENRIGKENCIDPGYADLLAWYENIGGFDALLMRDQNCDFVIINTDEGDLSIYMAKNIYSCEPMEPTLEYFSEEVVAYIKAEEKNMEGLLALCINNIEYEKVEVPECKVKALATVTYKKYDIGETESKEFTSTRTCGGFDYINDIKTLNSFEMQVEQYLLKIEEMEKEKKL